MNFMLDVQITSPEKKINYLDPVMLVGSCFTEHIGNNLQELKFQTFQNPSGILFDPQSVSSSIISYIHNKKYSEADLFYFNELWQCWNLHSMFSDTDKERCLQMINESHAKAHRFLKKSKWLILTLGSSFSYRLRENNQPVANCHRAPAQWFDKHLMTIEEINSAFDSCIHQLFQLNPDIRIILTVSPVRHIRDGVIDNNRSKARLIECIHHLVNKFAKIYYFPAYELVIDVLRDHRFYDIDMVHPNYQATEFVLQKFVQHYVDDESTSLMEEIRKVIIARKHKAFNPATRAHKKFLQDQFDKVTSLKAKHAFLDLAEELSYFSKNNE
ncbi:MAG TPA: GSCFA domain-containing protein [Puia sp.]|nr:GSCFA domain-containing protein [Puia sp.]